MPYISLHSKRIELYKHFTWTIHELYMDCIWNLLEPYMNHTWTIHELYLGFFVQFMYSLL